MAKISKKTIESLREFLDRGCDYAGTQETVTEIANEALRETAASCASVTTPACATGTVTKYAR